MYAIILKYNAEKTEKLRKKSQLVEKKVARMFFNTFGVLQKIFGLLTDSLWVLAESIGVSVATPTKKNGKERKRTEKNGKDWKRQEKKGEDRDC